MRANAILFAVDVDESALHLSCRVEDPAQHPHAFDHLECPGLHANGFGVQRRIVDRVDDSDVDSATGQFDGGREADRAGAGDEDIGVDHGMIMLRP